MTPANKEYQQKYFQANKARLLAYGKENHRRHAGTTARKRQRWAHNLKFLYNLSIADYEKMFKTQGGSCGICGKHQSEFKVRLAVDHNHKTGEIRGLLCNTCNSKLGWYENQSQNIEAYLGIK